MHFDRQSTQEAPKLPQMSKKWPEFSHVTLHAYMHAYKHAYMHTYMQAGNKNEASGNWKQGYMQATNTKQASGNWNLAARPVTRSVVDPAAPSGNAVCKKATPTGEQGFVGALFPCSGIATGSHILHRRLLFSSFYRGNLNMHS